MAGMRPRDFAGNEDNGYHNATLGTTGVAVAFPVGAQGAWVSVSAGCYVGVRDSASLVTFSDANYGSILNGAPYEFRRWSSGSTADSHIHIAPWATTAIVAIAFF